MYRLERASVVQSDRATGEGDPGRCCADRAVPEAIELDEGTYTVLAHGDFVKPGEIAQPVRCAVEVEEATGVPIGLHADEIAPGEGAAARVVVGLADAVGGGLRGLRARVTTPSTASSA